ncbi:hypothetical protein SEA_SAMISTI12_216 [Streptomyces phage Samisti12]|uniref:Uncharacterized protein n=7 Tax=Samistivirus TaxID=2560220 RepID=A0A223G064_9CAUD|nr:hypothetical protein FDI38_gp097 [Streptomyces phage Peebs]YP_009611610.1 hypothetical protein FDI39_gp092 [Streptomyces phage Samisti12]YP_010101590.1 hypothetical protein KNU49_gp098 [Streptomyces phage EGole]ASR76598.1 hypothetical protein SEA_SUSHI23_212 [Streptomyces phage Sushi23]QAX95902.1 hypothetical protein SEA_TEUTSCH_211 [Streptomyces phage Teutsch]QGH78358.1 hypothetical protein SEA_TRIBUTE_208 [Streptomyces phage Tribute]QRI46159.1 hypothetical protein SEA_CROSS_211 [Streptom
MGWGSGTRYFDFPLDLMLEYVPEDKRKEVIEALYREIRDGDWDTVDESAYFNLLVKYDIDGYGELKNDPDYLEELDEDEAAELQEM